MSEKILFVDDDANLLASAERNLRRRFQLETALGAEAALAKMAERGPYAVICSDRQMTGMDGIQFLSIVKQRAPDTVRLMLTGNADLESAIRVVNEGGIFTFLTKPCPQETLSAALDNALAQYRLIQSEKELLNKTLSGSIKLLSWAGIALCEWSLKAFVPIGWKIADFETKAATVVMETLDLAHSGFLDDDLKLGPSRTGGGLGGVR